MRSVTTFATAALIALTALAEDASGHGYIRKTGTVLTYSAADPEAGSQLTISSPRRGLVRISDPGTAGGITWGPCFPISQYAAGCNSKNLTRIEILLGPANDFVKARISIPLVIDAHDGDDRVVGGYERNVIDGGPGDDFLVGGAAGNSIVGDTGDDSLMIRNGVADPFACGAGNDVVIADPNDPMPLASRLECERTEVAPAPPDRRAPRAKVMRTPVKIGRKLAIDASIDEPGKISLSGKLSIGRRGAGKLRRAKANPDAPGQLWTLRLRVPSVTAAKTRRALAKGRRVSAALLVTSRDHAGNKRSRRVRLAVRR